MKQLLEKIGKLKKTQTAKQINSRIKEFEILGRKSSNEIFKELCFCILTANFNAEKAIKIQQEIGNGFLTLSQSQLYEKLKQLGHRYPKTRSKYITEARRYKDSLKNIINSEKNPRKWLIEHIKGIGYKESSHFLRNIGFENFAIIDFHIIDLLVRYNLIKKPKTLTKKRYLEIEQILGKIAVKVDLNLAQLDLYLWYIETGKILK